jgi:hypothetical protein
MGALTLVREYQLWKIPDKRDVGTIDTHLDPKSLKSAHSDAVKRTLRFRYTTQHG